jgi:hypothetical protein
MVEDYRRPSPIALGFLRTNIKVVTTLASRALPELPIPMVLRSVTDHVESQHSIYALLKSS